MTPRWEASSKKHGVPRADAVHAILHATFMDVLDERVKEGRVVLYIGTAHPQTHRELEILIHEHPESGAEASIFHVMELGPKFRRHREDNPHGWI